MADLTRLSNADLLGLYVRQEATQQGVDPELAARVLHAESHGAPTARSPKGALGPMQLMPATARDLGVDPNVPGENVQGGVRYLKQQLDRFHNPTLAVAAYNAGPGAVAKYGGVPPYAETQDYVRKTVPTDLSHLSDEQLMALYHNQAPAAPRSPSSLPQPAPSLPQATHADQALGFANGTIGVINRVAQRADTGLQRLGVPMDAINRAMGFPTASEAVQADHRALADAAARGVRPGRIGEFAGNVAVTAPLPGGPLLNGALTGAALSNADTATGVIGDALYGAAGGKIGASVVGRLGSAVKGVTGDALKLAQKGVPLTPGQAAGGFAKTIEDSLTSVPVVGSMIKGAQRRSLEGMNRAAYNDTLAHIDEALPEGISVGTEAYNYTKQRLADAYNEALAPLVVQRDLPFAQAISHVKSQIDKIGDPAVKAKALGIIKNEVQARFDKSGQMVGEELKGAQEALGSHINDLYKGEKYSRDAAKALGGVKTAIEDLVSRTNPVAGELLAKATRAYAHLKPLETAAAKPGAKDGIFTVAGMGMGIRKGKSAAAVAGGKLPHQDLFAAAANKLPSSVPDSGSAGRVMTGLLATGAGAHFTPAAPIVTPAVASLLGGSALYTEPGQRALTSLVSKRPPLARSVGESMRRLAPPAGTAAAALTATPAPVEVYVEGHPEYGVGRAKLPQRKSGKRR